jgi:hypothetical protein
MEKDRHLRQKRRCDLRGFGQRLFPVNELAMNLASEVVNDRYLKVLIVAQGCCCEILVR